MLYRDKRFLAVIPARSGSKGLKDKNIKILNGKPLIAYTIEAAKYSNIFDNIVVSTDSEKYAQISKEFGAEIPFIRPKYLAEDLTDTLDVIEYTLNKLIEMNKKFDYFMVLQPTSPFRNEKNILEAVEMLFKKNANAIISVCETEHTPMWTNTLDDSLNMDNFIKKDVSPTRQVLPIYYRLNGAIYLSDINYFFKYRNFYKEKSFAYIMNKLNSVDIDSELDFMFAKTLIKYKNIQ